MNEPDPKPPDSQPLNSQAVDEPTWYCVIDQEWMLLYLGTDRAAAYRAYRRNTILRAAPRMGDAMAEAAMNVTAIRTRTN